MEPIVMVMRRLEWFGRSDRERWKDTVRRDMEAWKIREEWATDRERWRDTVRRDMEAWKMKEEWATDRERWKDTVRRDMEAWKMREEWATDRELCKHTVRRDMEAWKMREEWATDRELCKDTVRRDMEAWKMRGEWATDRERCKGAIPATSYRETAAKGEKAGILTLLFLQTTCRRRVTMAMLAVVENSDLYSESTQFLSTRLFHLGVRKTLSFHWGLQ